MTDQNLSDNPFAALFSSVSQTESFIKTQQESSGVPGDDLGAGVRGEDSIAEQARKKTDLDVLLQQVFLITLDANPGGAAARPSRCVYLNEVFTMLNEQTWLDLESLEQAVFERLMLDDPGRVVVKTTNVKAAELSAASQAGEVEILRYLAQSYNRLVSLKQRGKIPDTIAEFCMRVIMQNGRTCLQQPEVFCNQRPVKQLLALLHETQEIDLEDGFLRHLMLNVDEHKEDGSLSDILQPIFDDMKTSLQTEPSMFHPNLQNVMHVVSFCTCSKLPCLAEAFLDYNEVDAGANCQAYENCLLGSLLSLSCVAKKDNGPFEFFDKPSARPAAEHNALESRLWERINLLNTQMYRVFHGLLSTKGDVRHRTLEWIANCLHVNAGRAKLWSSHMPQIFNQLYCSDGFFMNLCGVLLRLCVPFCKPGAEQKLTSFRPEYGAIHHTDPATLRRMNVHSKDMRDETRLLPMDADEVAPLADDVTITFITECIFMTHRCLALSFHVVNEKFVRLSTELHRIQQLYQEMQQQGAGNLEAGQRVQVRMDRGMSVYLSIKAALLEPNLLKFMGNFHLATSKILCQLAVQGSMTSFVNVHFPLPVVSTRCLTYIPESFLDNLLDYMIFLRRFKDEEFEIMGESLDALFTLILIYMGSPERVKNPHLRARMAEGLETLIPRNNSYFRQRLFTDHGCASQLAATLLNVFVSIEMTGQSVQFEQKFNYRHPMYKVLEYMWQYAIHKRALKELAFVAEEQIEAVDPPLFLRFVNLLINDAIFLLDEALSYLTQIKEKQAEKESGQWKALSPEQQQEQESNYRHLEMLCRYHNSMGNNTVHTLELLTREIKSIFNHNVLVDRVAAMLNYFLLHLVGPKRKNFKVKDFDGLEFKPHELVSNICRLYVNLAVDGKFCLAVLADGRSYSEELFTLAEGVLQRIGAPQDILDGLTDVAARVKACTAAQNEEDEASLDAPDDYLDPIMGSVMKDPVMLPSSQKIVDRTTIARHLLSDQNDPFNRSPLDMSMVVPMDDLRQEIADWLAEEKRKRRAQAKS